MRIMGCESWSGRLTCLQHENRWLISSVGFNLRSNHFLGVSYWLYASWPPSRLLWLHSGSGQGPTSRGLKILLREGGLWGFRIWHSAQRYAQTCSYDIQGKLASRHSHLLGFQRALIVPSSNYVSAYRHCTRVFLLPLLYWNTHRHHIQSK